MWRGSSWHGQFLKIVFEIFRNFLSWSQTKFWVLAWGQSRVCTHSGSHGPIWHSYWLLGGHWVRWWPLQRLLKNFVFAQDYFNLAKHISSPFLCKIDKIWDSRRFFTKLRETSEISAIFPDSEKLRSTQTSLQSPNGAGTVRDSTSWGRVGPFRWPRPPGLRDLPTEILCARYLSGVTTTNTLQFTKIFGFSTFGDFLKAFHSTSGSETWFD